MKTKSLHFIVKVILLLPFISFFRTEINAQSISNLDSLNYFFQRTIYLENLGQPGAWWSNPSLLQDFTKTTVYTSSTGLIGRRYSISTARILFPLLTRWRGGFGLTGSGRGEGRSLQGSQSGVETTSNFIFNQPSIEGALCYAFKGEGALSILQIVGSEAIPLSYDYSRNHYYPIWGTGLGVLTPPLFDIVSFSFSSFFVRHYQREHWWDKNAKTGIVFSFADSTVMGSLEYAFSFEKTGFLFTGAKTYSMYEAFKGIISLKMMSIAGLLLGYSIDTPLGYDNGRTYHAGIELRRSSLYPFFGGYEMGIATSRDIAIIHQIWVGYEFAKKR